MSNSKTKTAFQEYLATYSAAHAGYENSGSIQTKENSDSTKESVNSKYQNCSNFFACAALKQLTFMKQRKNVY